MFLDYVLPALAGALVGLLVGGALGYLIANFPY